MNEHVGDNGTKEPRPAGDLSDELKRLGEQLGETVKAAWESDVSRNIQRQLSEGLEQMAQELNRASQRAAESEEAERLKAQARRVADTARESDIGRELREGLVTGLREMNRALDRAIERMRKEGGAGEPPAGNEPPPSA